MVWSGYGWIWVSSGAHPLNSNRWTNWIFSPVSSLCLKLPTVAIPLAWRIQSGDNWNAKPLTRFINLFIQLHGPRRGTRNPTIKSLLGVHGQQSPTPDPLHFALATQLRSRAPTHEAHVTRELCSMEETQGDACLVTSQLQSGRSASAPPSSAILRARRPSATTMKLPLAKVSCAEQKANSCVGRKASPCLCLEIWKCSL